MADLDRPLTEPEKMAAAVRKKFDVKTSVRAKDVADRLGRTCGTVKSHFRWRHEQPQGEAMDALADEFRPVVPKSFF